MLNPLESDMRTEEIDLAFGEMSVDAPVSKENARLFLATESAQKALNGQSNVVDEAAYIRMSLYELSDPPDTLNSPLVAHVNTAKSFKTTTTPGGPECCGSLNLSFLWCGSPFFSIGRSRPPIAKPPTASSRPPRAS